MTDLTAPKSQVLGEFPDLPSSMAPQYSFPNHFQSNVHDYSFTEHSLNGFKLQLLCLPQLASQSQPSGGSRLGQNV